MTHIVNALGTDLVSCEMSLIPLQSRPAIVTIVTSVCGPDFLSHLTVWWSLLVTIKENKNCNCLSQVGQDNNYVLDKFVQL